MRKQRKLLSLTLALMLCAGVFLFPLTAYAEEETVEDTTTATVAADLEESADEIVADEDSVPYEDADPAEETESGIPPYDGNGNITPDGTGTVIDNVFIEGNGLEFFTFTTEAGNIFYLVVDRMRAQDNVYFLNAVTEADLLALAEKDGTTLTASTSGIPSTPGGTAPTDPTDDDPAAKEDPPADKGGVSSGSLIFILIGVAAVGGAGYYFKIVRPKQQRAADDDDSDYGDEEDYVDYGDDDDAVNIENEE